MEQIAALYYRGPCDDRGEVQFDTCGTIPLFSSVLYVADIYGHTIHKMVRGLLV